MLGNLVGRIHTLKLGDTRIYYAEKLARGKNLSVQLNVHRIEKLHQTVIFEKAALMAGDHTDGIKCKLECTMERDGRVVTISSPNHSYIAQCDSDNKNLIKFIFGSMLELSRAQPTILIVPKLRDSVTHMSKGSKREVYARG